MVGGRNLYLPWETALLSTMFPSGKKHARNVTTARHNFMRYSVVATAVVNVASLYVLSAQNFERLFQVASTETLSFVGATYVHGLIVGSIRA